MPSRNDRNEKTSMIWKLCAGIVTCLLAAAVCQAQDIPIGVTYVCSGEHIYVENCNIRDTSDNSTCMVAHPDHLTPTGMNTYTYLTRGKSAGGAAVCAVTRSVLERTKEGRRGDTRGNVRVQIRGHGLRE
jgi:hypothetical protein